MFITITNSGPDIQECNYWQTEAAQSGFFAISFNARWARILLPKAAEAAIPDMLKGCRHVVISRLKQTQNIELLPWAIEILFEDKSSSPFRLVSNSAGLLDFYPHVDDADEFGGIRGASLWVEGDPSPKKVAELPAYYRAVPRLPWLKPIQIGKSKDSQNPSV